MRLAHRAGVPVDRYLAQFTPEQFDEEVAFADIEPDEAVRTREVLKLGFAYLAAVQGGKVRPDELDPIKDEQPAAVASPGETAAMMAAQYGARIGE